MSEAPQDTCPITVYDPSPVQARAAGLYVCGRLPKDAATEVLAALGLIPTPSLAQARPGLRRQRALLVENERLRAVIEEVAGDLVGGFVGSIPRLRPYANKLLAALDAAAAPKEPE